MDVKFVLLVFALVLSCDIVITNDAAETDGRITDDVKKYVAGMITDITNKFESQIKSLDNEILNLQRKTDVHGIIIKQLKKENENLENNIKQLEKQTRPDINETPDTTVCDSNETQGKRSTSRVRRSNAKSRVAFYAYKSTPTPHLGEGQGIVFDYVTTNIGNAYNVHNSMFIAPVAGVYVFGVTLGHYSTFVQSDNGDGNLVVNGVIVAGLFMSNDQSSQMVVVNLKVGDIVAVLNRDADEGIDGKAYSSFSGFLLYEDDTVVLPVF